MLQDNRQLTKLNQAATVSFNEITSESWRFFLMIEAKMFAGENYIKQQS
jgi:hypothetical protein